MLKNSENCGMASLSTSEIPIKELEGLEVQIQVQKLVQEIKMLRKSRLVLNDTIDLLLENIKFKDEIIRDNEELISDLKLDIDLWAKDYAKKKETLRHTKKVMGKEIKFFREENKNLKIKNKEIKKKRRSNKVKEILYGRFYI